MDADHDKYVAASQRLGKRSLEEEQANYKYAGGFFKFLSACIFRGVALYYLIWVIPPLIQAATVGCQ